MKFREDDIIRYAGFVGKVKKVYPDEFIAYSVEFANNIRAIINLDDEPVMRLVSRPKPEDSSLEKRTNFKRR